MLIVNPVDQESEMYADLGGRAAKLLIAESFSEVKTCAFYDFALVCDGVDVTPKSGLVDICIYFYNNSVEHYDDVIYGGKFGLKKESEEEIASAEAGEENASVKEEEEGLVMASADQQADNAVYEEDEGAPVPVDEDIHASDELVAVNSDESSVIELTEGIITSLSIKGIDLTVDESTVGLFAGIVQQDGEEENETEAILSPDEPLILTATGKDYTVKVTCDASSGVPVDAALEVSEITEDADAYQGYLEETKKAMGLSEEEKLPLLAARFFDIKIMVDGEEFTPESGVTVEISYAELLAEDKDAEVNALHFAEGTDGPNVLDANVTEISEDGKSNVEFTAESFSVYGVVYTVEFREEVITTNGDTYEVTVKYGQDAGIPEGAELRVREIEPENEEYKALQEKADEKLAEDLKNAIPAHPVLFDISIVMGEEEIEPAAGSSVQVNVELKKGSVTGTYSDEKSPVLINDKPLRADEQEVTQKLQIIHDVDEGDLDVVDIEETNTEETVSGQFTTQSFSNWLVFLDEDVEEITVGRGDTITLRPYSQWVWNQQNTVDGQSVSWKYPQTNGHMDVDVKSYEDGELNQTYSFYQLTVPNRPNLGDFYVETTAGKKIHVIVQNDPVPEVPGTVDGLDFIKVNLFNYDKDNSLDVRDNVASYIDGQYYQDQSTNWQNRYGYKKEDGSFSSTQGSYANNGINNGSALKFLGWGARNGSNRINNYDSTHFTTQIVQNSLAKGSDDKYYPKLNGNGNTSLQYLFAQTFSRRHSDVDAHMGVTGLFRQDEDGYYYFNSNTSYAVYVETSNSFKLDEHTYTQATTRNNTSGTG